MKTDLELVNSTLSGEKKAFGELVLRYQKMLYRFVYRIIENSFDASDIVQETFIKAYQNLEQLKDRDKFSSWLFQIARNHCRNWITRCRENLASVEDELNDSFLYLPPAPDEILIERELHEQVMKAISKLPEYNRKAVEMFYLEGKSYSEIQEELGITKGTLGRWLHQARLELRKNLKEAYQGAIIWISGGLKRVLKSNYCSGRTLSHCSGRALSRPIGTATNATVISTAKCLVISVMFHVLIFTGMSITGTDWGILNGTGKQIGYDLSVETCLVKNKTPNQTMSPPKFPARKSFRQSKAKRITALPNSIKTYSPKYLKSDITQTVAIPKVRVDVENSSQFVYSITNTKEIPLAYSAESPQLVSFKSNPVQMKIPLKRQSHPMFNNLQTVQNQRFALDITGNSLAEIPWKFVMAILKAVSPSDSVLFGDDFSHPLNNKWRVGSGRWRIVDGKLENYRSKQTVSIWAKHKLPLNYQIDFDAMGTGGFSVFLNGTGRGKMPEYCYHVGISLGTAGIVNVIQRLGKTVVRDNENIIEYRKWYHFTITVNEGTISVMLDGKVILEYKDNEPLAGIDEHRYVALGGCWTPHTTIQFDNFVVRKL